MLRSAFHFCCTTLLTLCATAFAQVDLRAWRSFTRADGLPSNGVLDVVEDREARVWVACYGGVGRYDPASGTWTRFENVVTRSGITISLDQATSIAEQDDASGDAERGSIWVGTDGSGLLVHRPDGSWEQAGIEGSPSDLPSKHVHALLFASDGALWVGLDGFVCRRDPNTRTWEIFGPQVGAVRRRLPLPAGRPVYTMHEDKDHRIWVAGYDFGVHAWLGDRWVSFDDRGILDPKGELTSFEEGSRLPHRYIYAARHDGEGRIWLLSFGGGVALLSRDLQSFLPLPQGFQAASQSVCDLALDTRNAELWFATYEGITQLRMRSQGRATDELPWRHHRSGLHFAPGFFRRAHYGKRSGTVWFANRGGGLVGRIAVGYRMWPHGDPAGDARATAPDVRGGLVVDAKGSVWGATQDHVFRRDIDGTLLEQWASDALHLPAHAELQCLHADHFGHIWVGSSDGLARWDGTTWSVVIPQIDATDATQRTLEHLNVWEITRDRRDRLWLATRRDGALYLEGASQRWHQLLPETSDSTRQGLPSRQVYCIFEDRGGALWFGTLEGLACWREEQPLGQRWQSFSQERDGLSSNRIYAIQQDARGTLWIGSLRAVDRRRADGRFETLRAEQSQGYLEDGNYCFRILATNDGSLWFAIVGSGIVRYNANDEQWTGYQLPEDLAGVMVRGVAISSSARLWIATSHGLLSYDRDTARPQAWLPSGNPNVLSSEGSGTFFAMGRDVLQRTPPELLRFRFRVDDRDWGPYQSEARTRVEALAPGRHRLEVQALDRDFNVSPSAYLLFDVEFPWWQSPYVWGFSLGVLALIILAALLYRTIEDRRRSELERAETLSAAMSGMVAGGLPSFLGPQNEEARAGVLGHSDTAEYEKLLRSGLRLVPDVLLSDLAREVLAAWEARSPDVRFELSIQSGESGANLDPEKLRLVIDHLVRNAVEAIRETDRSGTVAIQITRSNARPWRGARLILRVIDSGPGIKDEALQSLGTPFNSHGRTRHAGLGLYHCYQIAALHNGSLHLRRQAPMGTCAELQLPCSLQA